ncbi:MAG: iron-containing alcohol dehydrogenase [Syntrophothermus sp.]|uniref:iron-containing alcohol dehydrogenase n=1 Tax=Syntrophothermus sp. TaxID=2736299 RepID=UPI00257BFC01|nr:iron-containing alcohol dehydrogenase [Syntrophothermus sp.]NSW84136.1 iron-containing alcohol dehydrogenase [Syntrophothermus sp.]
MFNLTGSHRFVTPSLIYYGVGCVNSIGEALQKFGSKALIVSDPCVAQYGHLDKIANILSKSGLQVATFTEVTGEPTDIMVQKASDVFREEKCDCCVAVGGGSALDTAKAVAIVVTEGKQIAEFEGYEKAKRRDFPLVLIPTTAGTGSEVTKVTVITDTERHVKMMISSSCLVPDMAVIDPELTLTVPPNVTVFTGIDTLTHAVEAFISRRATPVTDKYAIEAIRLVAESLRIAWANGDDIEARSKMSLAAFYGGLAFSNASVNLVHGMARPLGALFNLPHGLANAILLPIVMSFSWPAAPEKFARIAQLLGENVTGLSTLEAAKLAVSAVENLCRDVEVPKASELGIKADRLNQVVRKMAEDALASGSPANNPRRATIEQIEKMYLSLLSL